jgi:ATP-dependent Clp protease ATP-binding subunit ClpA
MLSPNLEQTLHRALAYANERRHDFATLEHLLLALTEDQDAIAVMRACNVDVERLRRDLIDYIDNQLSNLVGPAPREAKPTAGFQRVLQRAATSTRCSAPWKRSRPPRCSPPIWNRPCTAPSPMPMSGATNTRRSSICCWR